MTDMKKNTPLLIFTGLAVAAVGTFGAVVTGTWPLQPEQVAETVVAAPEAPVAEAPKEPEKAPEQAPEQALEKPPESQVAVAPAPDQAAAPAKVNEPAPAAPAIEAPAARPEAPSFDTVNVLPSGEAVIAGHAQPGSEVVVKFAGTEVGKATTGPDGSFAIVPDKPLPAGAGALTLETMIDGQLVASQEQIAIVVDQKKPALVAKVEPDAPTKVVQAPASGAPPKEVQLSTVDYDAAGNIIFQGRVTPGGTVRFYVDNQAVGDTKADEQGNWIFQGQSPIAPGNHSLRADEIDGTGKVLSRAETPFLREEVEKVVAAAVPPVAAPADQVQTKSEVTADAAAGEPAVVVEQPAAPPAAEPAAAPAAEVVVAAATAERPSRIIIQPGNNLWRISREVYGKGKMFTVIWDANRDLIKNPDRIYPGQILTAPKS
jgi:nucleoid-associated protein YgaU